MSPSVRRTKCLLACLVLILHLSVGFVSVLRSPTFSNTFHSFIASDKQDPRPSLQRQTLSTTEKLNDIVYRNDTRPLTFIGYVTAKRQISRSLIFLDFFLGDSHNRTDSEITNPAVETYSLQALLKQDAYLGGTYSLYQRCLHKGTKLKITGQATSTFNPGNVVLLIKKMELLTVPRHVQHIETILRQFIAAQEAIEDGSNDYESETYLKTYREFQQQVSQACGFERIEDLCRQVNQVISSRTSNVSHLPFEQIPLRDLAKTILHGNLEEDPNYPTCLVDDRTISHQTPRTGGCSFVIPKAPMYFTKPPSTLTATVKPTYHATYLTKKSFQDIFDGHDGKNDTQLVVHVEGRVQNRQRFQENITVIFLEDDVVTDARYSRIGSRDCQRKRLECVLHPNILTRPQQAHIYRNLVSVGSTVSLHGTMLYRHNDDPTGKGPVLWIDEIRLVNAGCQPSTLFTLFLLVQAGQLDTEEAASALFVSHREMMEIVTNMTITEQKWKANLLSLSLKRSHRTTTRDPLSKCQRKVVEKYRYLLYEFPVVHAPQRDVTVTQNLPRRDLSIHDDVQMSRWETKKLPQIKWICQQINDVLCQHPDYGRRKLSILDVGGGKGRLAHHLSRDIENVEINVVDTCARAIRNGLSTGIRMRNRKEKLPLSMVNFHLADASTSKLHFDADVVVALHACGHLTDVALYHAFASKASFVIVPCCYNSNSHLTIPDTTSIGTGTPVHTWLGIPEDDLTQLKSMAEIQGDVEMSLLGMRLLNAIRSRSMQRNINGCRSANSKQANVKILSFPIEYSTRNMALIGSYTN
jgi:hypothetical protein